MTMFVWCIPKIRINPILAINSQSAKISIKKGVFSQKGQIEDKERTNRGQIEDK